MRMMNTTRQRKSNVEQRTGYWEGTTTLELENIMKSIASSGIGSYPANLSARMDSLEREIEKLELHLLDKHLDHSGPKELLLRIIARHISFILETISKLLIPNDRTMSQPSMESLAARACKTENNAGDCGTVADPGTEMTNGGKSISKVSRREQEILENVIDGKSNRDIAHTLGISEQTVKNHLWKIYRKLGVKSRTQLFRCLMMG
jgi:ATP/maltotriose-dependent transcriptional regulator MalT